MEARHPSEGMPSGRGRADGERSQLVGRVADLLRLSPSLVLYDGRGAASRGGGAVRTEKGEWRGVAIDGAGMGES